MFIFSFSHPTHPALQSSRLSEFLGVSGSCEYGHANCSPFYGHEPPSPITVSPAPRRPKRSGQHTSLLPFSGSHVECLSIVVRLKIRDMHARACIVLPPTRR